MVDLLRGEFYLSAKLHASARAALTPARVRSEINDLSSSASTPIVLRQFAGFEVDRYSLADVPLQVAELNCLSGQSTGSARVVPRSDQNAGFLAGADADGDLVHEVIVARLALIDLLQRVRGCPEGRHDITF